MTNNQYPYANYHNNIPMTNTQYPYVNNHNNIPVTNNQYPYGNNQNNIPITNNQYPYVNSYNNNMPSGVLQVLLVNAHGLKSTDLFSKSDPYIIISCGKYSLKSYVCRNQGPNPVWNQNFVFPVMDDVREITLRIMDEDTFTEDDEIGTIRIPMDTIIVNGIIKSKTYPVVQQNGRIKGEVLLSLAYSSKRSQTRSITPYTCHPSNHSSHESYFKYIFSHCFL